MNSVKCGFNSAYVPFTICIIILWGSKVMPTLAYNDKIMACYFTVGKSQNFSGDAVDPDLCTHIICAGGLLSPDGIEASPINMEQFKAVASLKAQRPTLKVMISLGHGFQSVADQPSVELIKRFAVRAVTLLEKLNMDGLDLDWEFPEVYEKTPYITFIQILAQYLHTSNMLLSMALSADPSRIDNGIDIDVIEKHVDFVTIMNYDYHTYRDEVDNVTGYNSPLYTPKGEAMYLSTADSLTYFLYRGLSSEKILMGIPTYGHSWNLKDPNVHGLHSPANGIGAPAPYSSATGVYLYTDVCIAEKMGATRVIDEENVGEYIYYNSTWVAFEGKYSISQKMQWLKKRKLGGIGIWAYQLDDIYDNCGNGPSPLLHWLRDALQSDFSPEL